MLNPVHYLAALIASLIIVTSEAHAELVTISKPIELSFSLPVVPPFSLPAVIVDYTIAFARADLLNPGESVTVDTYSIAGDLLQSDTYQNTSGSNIIGCACFGGLLDTPLSTTDFFIRVSTTSGTFDVTEVVALAYDASNGLGDQVRAVGVLRSVPEPSSLSLAATILAGLAAVRRRTPVAREAQDSLKQRAV